MRKLLLAAVCLLTTLGWSQGTAASGIPVVATGTGQPIAGATVAVCSADPGSTPSSLCTGSLVTTFTSSTLSVSCTPNPVTKAALSGVGCTNPGLSDGLGNVIAYANPAACWLEYTGNGIIGIVVMPCTFPALSTTGGVAIKVNGGSTLTSPVNFQNGSAVNGITISFANPSASNVTAAISGALTNAGIANPSTTVNGQTCTLGSTCTINGILSGLTAGIIPQAGSATSIVNSTPQLDNGVTTPNTLTYVGSGGLALTPSGPAGIAGLGQGTAQGLGTNSVGLTAPTGVTSYNYVWPAAAGSGVLKGTNIANIVTGSIGPVDLTADVGATILPPANGGTGIASPALHKLIVGNGTSAMTQLVVGPSGTVLIGNTGADPSFSATPVLGATGALPSSLGFTGLTSGVVTIQPQSIAGTYNYNLPITAGTAGDCQKSGGGGGSPMTWGTCGGTPAYSAITAGSNTVAKTEGTSGSLSPVNLGQIMANNSWFSSSLPVVPGLTCVSTGGSILGGHNVFVRLTFTTALGESLAGPEGSISITGGNCGGATGTNTVTVAGPTLASGVLSYTVYSQDSVSVVGGAEKQQTVSNNCVNLASGVNCVITVGGAGASVPSTNTAWLNAPPGSVTTRCPLGADVNTWTQNAAGTWDEFAAQDVQTVNPPTAAGHFTYCYGPVYFNDSGVQPDAGVKNSFLSVYHVPGAIGDGTQASSTRISPTIGFVYANANSPGGSVAMEQHLAVYGELQLGNNSTTCSPVGGESCASAIRGVFTDIRTSGTLSVGQPISGVAGVSFRASTQASPVSSCLPCYTGVRGEFYNLQAASLGNTYHAGVIGEISDTAGAPLGNAFSLWAAMGSRFSGQNGGLFISSAFSNAADYAIRSDATARSHFSGDMNLQTLSAGGGGLPVTGGLTVLSGVQSNQLANTAPGGTAANAQGVTGATAYTYRAVAKDPTGGAVAITTVMNVANGNATLTGANFNRVSFNSVNFCALGITSFDVYRTASAGTPSTTGKIGSFPITDCTAFFGVSQKFDDTGLAGDGTALPAGNTSGGITATGYITGTLNKKFVTADFTTAANTSLQTITGLSWTTPPGAGNYQFHCSVVYSQATANVAVAFGIQAATVAPTAINASGQEGISLTAAPTTGTLRALATTTATNIVSATPSAFGAIGTAADMFNVYLDGTLELPVGENTINIMVSTANSADLVTVYRGGYCHLF